MKILCLPGQNKNNENWIKKLASSICLPNSECIIHSYDFWSRSDSSLEPELEIDLFCKHQPDVVVAKSLGSILAALSVNLRKIKPHRVIFIGIPLNGLARKELGWFTELGNLGIKGLIIQQRNDKTGSFKEISSALPTKNFEFVEVEGSDHKYTNLSSVSGPVNNWLRGKPANKNRHCDS